jgi:phosphoenolpyruvate synthase/pyruvate phosphate dikinase
MKVYSFGLGIPSEEMSPEVLGGKGAGLVWMDSNGVKVPPGFIIPCDASVAWNNAESVNAYTPGAKSAMLKAISDGIDPWLTKLKGKFGYMPLVSVRSGARVSMPGMMDTILNVGLDETNAQEWVDRLGKNCVTDSRKRLVEMFGSVVKGIDRQKFHNATAKEARDIYCNLTGEHFFPQAKEQLLQSIAAVFESWNNERAKIYRKMNNIPDTWGTAVVVQAMVFGNLNEKSCTGVLFTRDCNSGENQISGEFLINAQGEDVVAGIRTPDPLIKMSAWNPTVCDELIETSDKLEQIKKDVQDIEFTVQDGELFILQTRNAKRSSRAAVRIAVEMQDEGIVSTETALKRVRHRDYIKAQASIIDPKFATAPLSKGLPACAGIATGKIVMSSAAAIASKVPCILFTKETTPDDIGGMAAAKGVLTIHGGATSHAAVVARSMNKACIVGIGSEAALLFSEGDEITLDGASGRIWKGKVPVISGKDDPYVKKLETLIAASAKCGLIDDKDADVLDLSGMLNSPATAVLRVVGALAKRETVIVDVSPDRNTANEAFNDMFGKKVGVEQEIALVNSIIAKVGAKKVWFLTNAPKADLSDGVQLIARVNEPEDLVMAAGDFVLDVKPEPWVTKLVSWKKQLENCKPISLGMLIDGNGYLSRAQLAENLLAE